MCLAQTTNASRLLFALGRHFMPRGCEKNWKFWSLGFKENELAVGHEILTSVVISLRYDKYSLYMNFYE